MQVDVSEIEDALDKARAMVDHYKLDVLNGNAYPRSVDDLFDITKKYIEKPIDVYVLEDIPEDNSIRGTFLPTEDGYEIYLSKEPTKCKDRFVLCKELFHVILDDEPYRNMDVWSHLEDMLITWPTTSTLPSKSTASERMAECAAMEFLFPYKERVKQIVHYEENPPLKHLSIADYYKVPQYLVEIYLSKSFMNTFKVFDR